MSCRKVCCYDWRWRDWCYDVGPHHESSKIPTCVKHAECFSRMMVLERARYLSRQGNCPPKSPSTWRPVWYCAQVYCCMFLNNCRPSHATSVLLSYSKTKKKPFRWCPCLLLQFFVAYVIACELVLFLPRDSLKSLSASSRVRPSARCCSASLATHLGTRIPENTTKATFVSLHTVLQFCVFSLSLTAGGFCS